MGDTKWTEDSAIHLHPEMVKQRQDTYSSLTDLYGIHIFSDEFAECVDDIQGKYEKENTQLREKIFVNESVDTIDADAGLISKLFAETQERILRQEYEKTDMRMSVMDIGILVSAVLAVAAIYLFIFGNKKIRRKTV